MAKPTKKDLLARAHKLGIEGLTEKSKIADIEKAITEAEARTETIRYGGKDLPLCHCGRVRNHVHRAR